MNESLHLDVEMFKRISKPSAEMAKWWGKGTHEVGRVTRHLSPFEQRPAAYLIKTIPTKFVRKIRENALTVGGTVVGTFGIIYLAEAEHDRFNRAHWS